MPARQTRPPPNHTHLVNVSSCSRNVRCPGPPWAIAARSFACGPAASADTRPVPNFGNTGSTCPSSGRAWMPQLAICFLPADWTSQNCPWTKKTAEAKSTSVAIPEPIWTRSTERLEAGRSGTTSLSGNAISPIPAFNSGWPQKTRSRWLERFSFGYLATSCWISNSCCGRSAG